MTLIVGVCLWGLVLAACVMTTRRAMPWSAFTWRAGACGTLIVFLSVAFLMRPEEEIKTGDDPAAYFNMALTYARTRSLSFVDPALRDVAPEERSLFRYGSEHFGLTKDHCFWIKDVDSATVGPWFQPSFSLLLSVPVFLFGPYAALLVTPLFALLVALLMACLVVQLLGIRWALMTFLLFVIHPVVAWNGRCVRPELVALCMLLSGLLIPVFAPQRLRGSWLTGSVLGAAAACSVLLHITAFYVLVPALLLVAWNTRLNCQWFGWWFGAAMGLVLFVLQLLWVGDPYGIMPSLMLPSRRLLVAGFFLLGVAFWFCLLGRGVALRVLWRRLSKPLSLGLSMPLAVISRLASVGCVSMCGVFVIGVLWIYLFRDQAGRVPGLPNWVNAYLSLSDFKGVAIVSSRVWSLTALMGVFALCVFKPKHRAAGFRALILFAPAALLSGWMYIYMFETRRLLIAVVPLMVISLVALLEMVFSWGQWLIANIRQNAFSSSRHEITRLVGFQVLAVLVVGVFAVSGRVPLYKLWNRKGTLAFFEQVSETVRDHSDYLLAEYTQTAAPIAHLTGLPLLPIASDYRSDEEYRAAEQAMARVVQQHPERRYLFVTPFESAALAGVAMEPLGRSHMQTRILERHGRREVPSHILANDLTLNLYRLRAFCEQPVAPYARSMGGSRLGIKGAARRFVNRVVEDHGVPLRRYQTLRLPLDIETGSTATVTLVIYRKPIAMTTDPVVSVVSTNGVSSVYSRAIVSNWWAVDMGIGAGVDDGCISMDPFELALDPLADGWLTDMFINDSMGVRRVELESMLGWQAFELLPMDFQWLRAKASLALPAPSESGRLWIYATGGDNDRQPATLSIQGPSPALSAAAVSPLVGDWAWHILPYSRNANVQPGVFDWYDFRVSPAWNPHLAGYPTDLGCVVALVVAVSTGERSED